MAGTITVGNDFEIRFGEDVSAEAVEAGRAKLEKFKADPVVQAALAKAKTVEEAYDALVSYVDCTLEEFRDFFERVAHRVYDLAMGAAEPREELTEEELDVVAGGGFWSWLNRNFNALLETVGGAVVAVVGAGTAVFGAMVATLPGGQLPGAAVAAAGVGMITGGAFMIKDGVKRFS